MVEYQKVKQMVARVDFNHSGSTEEVWHMCKIPWKKFYIYVLYSKIVTRDVGNFFLHPDKSGLVLSVQDLKLFRQLW